MALQGLFCGFLLVPITEGWVAGGARPHPSSWEEHLPTLPMEARSPDNLKLHPWWFCSSPCMAAPCAPQAVHATALTLITPAPMPLLISPLWLGPLLVPQGLARCRVGTHLRKSRRGRVVVGMPSAGQLRKWNCVRVRVSCDCTFFR